MKAYFIANFTVTDLDKYKSYQMRTIGTLIPLFQAGQGKVLVSASGDTLGTKEGVPFERIVIIEFESKDIAEKWYNSEEYQLLKEERQSFTKDIWLTITEQFILPTQTP